MRLFSINQEKPVQFLVCGNLISNEKFLHMRRILNENVLILVQKGVLYINSCNKSYEVGENQFIVLKAGEEHFGYKQSEKGLSYFWVHFKTAEDLKIVSSENESSTQKNDYIFPESGSLTSSGKLNLLFRQLMDFSLEEQFYNKSVLDYMTSVLLMELSNQYLSQKNLTAEINPVIFEICSWIKQNYSHQFTINDLAKISGYQSEYLSALFKKNMGITILQYVNKIRIETAKKLLPNFSIKETAWSCGFEDEKYFMKVFKKSEGITPTEYKNAFFKKYVNS